MKQCIKQNISSAFAFILFGMFNPVFADTASDTETLLNWAENTYPEIFPSHEPTQDTDPWLFRFYEETGVYVGVNKEDEGVYVMGGQWGIGPTFLDSLSAFLAQIPDGNGGIAACDTTDMPEGFSFSQSENVVTVSTNEECIALPPDTANFCKTPLQPSATGISVLSESNNPSGKLSGITVTSPFDPALFGIGKVKNCTINAPAEQANLIVNTDICLDIPDQIEAIDPDLKDRLLTLVLELSSKGIIDLNTIDPPFTYEFKATYENEVVADCFATDADRIYDAFTDETWVKQNGTFVKISN